MPRAATIRPCIGAIFIHECAALSHIRNGFARCWYADCIADAIKHASGKAASQINHSAADGRPHIRSRTLFFYLRTTKSYGGHRHPDQHEFVFC